MSEAESAAAAMARPLAVVPEQGRGLALAGTAALASAHAVLSGFAPKVLGLVAGAAADRFLTY